MFLQTQSRTSSWILHSRRLLGLALMVGLSGCASPSSYSTGTSLNVQEYSTTSLNSAAPAEDSWSIYWYLCGSDLESRYGAGTQDLQEMLKVKLPENVQVIIQTGGATQWKSSIDPRQLTRYLYNSDGLFLLDETTSSSMGNAQTLADFLSFAKTNFPAEHTMALFWNHGGGSVTGAAFDEIYRYDSLTLDEFHDAFDQVYTLDADNPPFDIVGFDACLMATIDTANTFKDISQYLVASEEVEPGCGWDYTGWMQAFARNPQLDAEELGQAICDTYKQTCTRNRVGDEITLSVTDLSQADDLLKAYDQIGKEALYQTYTDQTFFSRFGRAANQSENYGGNTPSQGYTNMVDLGHLVRNTQSLLPQNAQSVLDGLDECVVYRVNGPYHNQATGLSCYYSYNGDLNDFRRYQKVGASESFKQLYDYAIYGNMDEDALTFMFNGTLAEPDQEEAFDVLSLNNFPVQVNKDGNAVMTLGKDNADQLTGVYAELAYFDPDANLMIKLGRDNDLDMNWKTGTFTDNFRGVWGSIDGHMVYMELVYEGDDYNTYSVPILLNGEACNLRVVYDYTTDTYNILGARKGLSDDGAADKYLIRLNTGDEVTTVHYASTMDEDDDFEPYASETFTVTKNTAFEEAEVGDGQFVMFFEMVTPSGANALSAPIVFTVDGDDIYTTTDLD